MPEILESSPPIIRVGDVKKAFKKDRQDMLVLSNVNLELHEGEIVALLGKSGSGKSTLLRIIAGLIPPTSGEVSYHGKAVLGPMRGLAMVFQNFALLPWLTVLQNVELGLEALGVKKDERRSRAIQAIDIVGLDGFESAYPKELSGGMSQRVGLARALVVDPEVLLMDEPFSALDVLTAENLRGDLLDLWQAKKAKIKNILLVTHNIEEAVFLADRILVFGNNPGNVRAELRVDIPHPRHSQDQRFIRIVDSVYDYITMPATMTPGAEYRYKNITMGYRLPNVQASEIIGVLDMMNEPQYRGHKIDLPEFSDELHLDIDDLFPLTEALEVLRFAQVSTGDIELNEAGKIFATVDILERKKIFAQHLLKYIPLASYIRRVLDERPEHHASQERFLGELEDYLSEDVASEVLRVVIDWGRYAEIFAYDYNTGQLSLENPN
ncbi:MAG: nitrate ABC transporter ATP-binding protein [Gammaproteobacteria bacterium GWE2_37_16]|nr:MAG: nitrate ABC transporter ATP-binding protein [Gammaproteobacteria bacterium GWE2_37_16]